MPALRILVTGGSGFLAGHLVAAVRQAGHVAVTTGRSGGDIAVDLTARGMVAAVVEAARPDVALHLAACSRLADCERDPAMARAVNVGITAALAERLGARLLVVSTDLVFDGRGAPYAVTAPVSPLSVYGATKAEAEEVARAGAARVVRVPLLFGPDPRGRGASASLRAAWARGERTPLFTDEYRTPLHAADAARILVGLVVDPAGPSLAQLAGPERVSRWEFGRRLAGTHGVPLELLLPTECQDPLRPRDCSLVPTIAPRRSLAAMLADC